MHNIIKCMTLKLQISFENVSFFRLTLAFFFRKEDVLQIRSNFVLQPVINVWKTMFLKYFLNVFFQRRLNLIKNQSLIRPIESVPLSNKNKSYWNPTILWDVIFFSVKSFLHIHWYHFYRNVVDLDINMLWK